MVTGRGYCWDWKSLVAHLHIGVSGVMVIYCPHRSSALGVFYQNDRAALFRDGTALPPEKSCEKHL